MSMRKLVERWKNENKAHNFEGERGVRRFEELTKALGYLNLECFLSDNSGVIDEMIEWICDCNCSEWEENLQENLQESLNHSDEDEDEDWDDDDDIILVADDVEETPPSKPVIICEVSGGVLQCVKSSVDNIEVNLLDHDNYEDEENKDKEKQLEEEMGNLPYTIF